MPSEQPKEEIPQEVYDELELYKSCYEYLREWYRTFQCKANMEQRTELVSNTVKLFNEVRKMQEQKASK